MNEIISPKKKKPPGRANPDGLLRKADEKIKKKLIKNTTHGSKICKQEQISVNNLKVNPPIKIIRVMGTLIDNILEKLHHPRGKKTLSREEAREELQSLRSERERSKSRIQAIEKSHWYAINECPQRREKDLKAAQEAFYRVCARMSDLGAMLYRRRPQTKEVLFFKERQGSRLYRLVLSERDPEKYFLGILGPELVYQERRPMSLEEFRKSHPNAIEPEPQETQQALESLLQRLKVFMGYYAL